MNLEEGEELLLEEYFQRGRMQPFGLVLTNRAIFLPMKKRFAIADPWYFRRVPLSDVCNVSLQPFRPTGMWILALSMGIAGLTALLTMPTTEWATPSGGQVNFYPSGLVFAGVLLPVAAAGRYELAVGFVGGEFRWRGPMTLWRSTKREAIDVQRRVLSACRDAHLEVSDGTA